MSSLPSQLEQKARVAFASVAKSDSHAQSLSVALCTSRFCPVTCADRPSRSTRQRTLPRSAGDIPVTRKFPDLVPSWALELEDFQDGNGLMAAGPIGDPAHPMPIWRWLSLSKARMAPIDPGSSSWHPEDGPARPGKKGESVAALAP
jgi:hypothetical protein